MLQISINKIINNYNEIHIENNFQQGEQEMCTSRNNQTEAL